MNSYVRRLQTALWSALQPTWLVYVYEPAALHREGKNLFVHAFGSYIDAAAFVLRERRARPDLNAEVCRRADDGSLSYA